MRITRGKLKVWFDVASYIYQKVAMLIMLFGVLRLNQVSWSEIVLYSFLGVPVLVYAVYLYMTYLYPDEQKYLDNKKPVQREILERVRKLSKDGS